MNRRIALFFILLCTVIGVQFTGIASQISIENIDSLFLQASDFHPIFYIAALAIAPVLFLPEFPLVIVGSLLYGQTWGLLYAMLGAVIGASLSFCFARYIARHWVHAKIRNSRLQKVEEMTQNHGWQIVIILRLIPIFPFTPLNYALGLTGVKLHHYIIATTIGILPACTAFILFANSFWSRLQGKVTTGVILGIFLATAILLGLALYKKSKKQ